MSHLSTIELSKLAGITKRQVQRLLLKGVVPGAERTPASHWEIPDSNEVRAWAKNFQRWEGKPRSEAMVKENRVRKNELKAIGKAVRKPIQERVASETKNSNDNPAVPTDFSDDLAREIQRLHMIAETKAKESRTGIEEACLAREGVARMVDAGHARAGTTVKFAEWWRAAGLPKGWGRKYMTTARTPGDRTKGALRRFGILPEADTHNDQQHRREDNPFAWTKQAKKLAVALTKKSVSEMSELDKITARKHLESIMEVCEALKA